MTSITCAHCKGTHHSVKVVRICATEKTFVCGWQYWVDAGYDPDLEDWTEGHVRECDGIAWSTARGVECEHGHEHVWADVRHREGWDYASDPEEAAGLRKYGMDAVGMDGGSI